MADYQVWLVRLLDQDTPVTAFMRTTWGWPAMESLHFIGLALLLGPIVVFDLRLLGVARRVPIATLHHLVPWGVGGFALSVVTGTMFLMTEPDQYVYNPSFHLKMVLLALAGCNALAFYVLGSKRALAPGAGPDAPRVAKAIAIVSLTLWFGIVVCGRLITFYRPGECPPEGPGVVATCVPR